jgi:hypothetical protein
VLFKAALALLRASAEAEAQFLSDFFGEEGADTLVRHVSAQRAKEPCKRALSREKSLEKSLIQARNSEKEPDSGKRAL